MKRTVTSLALATVIGLVLLGCQQKTNLASSKQKGPMCCGAPMLKEGSMAHMKCPDCGKTALMHVKCPACGKMMVPDFNNKTFKCPGCGKTVKMETKCHACEKTMQPTGGTMEMYRCPTCGKISITGGSTDLPG
jgi:predicted RNA-binding Zn-ribbon protein involved in translation (DUF1610 family)